ncbi:hypothetical protein KEM56_003629 [Ascosphaera pollenicola]|nr:hypothetical protein KEM56_003629 [Ascosphaera pollenicola]
MSFPRFVGDLPVNYDHLKSARQANKAGQVFENGTMDFGRSYVFGSPYPWYEFGYGLSYSEFEYGNVTLSTRNVSKCQNETIYASVNVTNKGPYPGQEVVQLYVVDEIATVDISNKSLRGFEKIKLDCNETKEVKIPIKLTDLALWSLKNQYVVEAGDFRVEIGKSATNIMTNATFHVAKDEVVKI